MEVRQLTEELTVAGQIGPEHIPAIKQAGFRSIVCNRPDSETGAVPHDLVHDAAKAVGLEFRFIPVVGGAITGDNVTDMAAALAELPKPVLAYCRTGARCANLFLLIQQTGAPVQGQATA
ncbi:MAG: TIGR01244 family phosphatase [Notoacmeibacter sp.]|nr:TIGR01244 family phosphatase [Notoacmeibacter sp.]